MSLSLLESYPTPTRPPEVPSSPLTSLSHEPQPNMIQPSLDERIAPPTTGSRPVRVLLVDDEQPMRAMARVIVESLGLEAIEAATGEDALVIYRDYAERGETINIVIMDLALPGGMSGLEASRSLLDYDPEVSIMISSGYLNQNSRQPALNQGFAGVLPKPYTIDRLASEIHYILNRKNTEEEQ